jgi:hypothetical protein
MHGPGKFTWANGDCMEAHWSAGVKEDGPGIFTTPRGDRYEGQFKGENKHGDGVYQWAHPSSSSSSSSSSSGRRVGGLESARGQGGDRYEGSWKNNVFDGKGRMTYSSTGDVYVVLT